MTRARRCHVCERRLEDANAANAKLTAERDAALAKLQEPDVYLRKALQERDEARADSERHARYLSAAQDDYAALRTKLEGLEQQFRKRVEQADTAAHFMDEPYDDRAHELRVEARATAKCADDPKS